MISDIEAEDIPEDNICKPLTYYSNRVRFLTLDCVEKKRYFNFYPDSDGYNLYVEQTGLYSLTFIDAYQTLINEWGKLYIHVISDQTSSICRRPIPPSTDNDHDDRYIVFDPERILTKTGNLTYITTQNACLPGKPFR